MKFNNIIGGREFSFSSNTFFARSPYFPDFSAEVAAAGPSDIKMAVNYAQGAQKKLLDLGFEGRKKILAKAAEQLKFSEDDVNYCTSMMGMPRSQIEVYLDDVPLHIAGMAEMISRRYIPVGSEFGRELGDGFFEMKVPREGFLYSVVPSNDPRATSFVFSVASSLGIPVVLKISKNELPIAHKIANAALDAGYPKEAVNMLCWDTEKNGEAKKLHFQMMGGNPAIFMPFGSDDTVESELRYEERRVVDLDKLNGEMDGGTLDAKVLEEFAETWKINKSNGLVVPHTSGNCAAIVDGDVNPKDAAELVGYSAFHYPISCKAAKAVYVDESVYGPFLDALEAYVEKLEVGNPLGENIDVGYVDQGTLDEVLLKVDELERLGQVKKVIGGERLGPFQARPLVIEVEDSDSPFLRKEFSMYLLAVKKVGSLAQAVDECNLEGYKQRLAVSVLTDRPVEERMEFLGRLRSDQSHVNEFTRFLHPPAHQGVMYPDRFSTSRCIYLGR